MSLNNDTDQRFAGWFKPKTLCLAALGLIVSACSPMGLFALNNIARLGEHRLIPNINYGPLPEQRLDIYVPTRVPADQAAGRPVVLFFYGGCWGGCRTYTREYYRFIGDTLTSAGYVAVIADYRHHPQVRFPEIMGDVAATTAWVQDHIAEYGGNPDQLFLAGHSAGAHMAVTLSVQPERFGESLEDHARRDRIAGFIGLAGPYDFLPLDEEYQFQLFGPPERYPESQPVHYVTGNEPPMLLLHGNADETVGGHNIDNMVAKIRAHQGDVEAIRYDGVSHIGILTALARPMLNRTPIWQDIQEFIKQQTGTATTKSP